MKINFTFCKRCLYSSNHPLGLILDSDGICSGCRIHEEKDSLDWSYRFEKIKDKEIQVLEDYLNYYMNGESDSWWPIHTLTGDTLSRNYPLNEHLKSVEWIDETPEEIKDEFEKKFRDNNYRDVIDEGEEAMSDGDWEFFDKNNNISAIYFNINSKGVSYEIQWLNNKIGK